jgi:hypothetical protein
LADSIATSVPEENATRRRRTTSAIQRINEGAFCIGA